MELWLHVAAKHAIVAINAVALLVIVIGTIEAFIRGMRAMLLSAENHQMRQISVRYGRWLVSGLTFQLAADIVETSITPTWEDIGRLAAIAVIRTFLSYVLEQELLNAREPKDEPERPA